MVVNNFWKVFSYVQSILAAGTGYTTIDRGQVDLSGNTFGSVQAHQQSSTPYLSSMFNFFYPPTIYLNVGTGTTAPEATDYCLESDVTSSFSALMRNVAVATEDNSTKITFTLSGTNSTANAITLTEFGVILMASDMNYNRRDMLIARELLNNPITVEPNGVLNFTAVWTFS